MSETLWSMRTFKSVIFDMDGVLIDTEKQWRQTETEVFTSLGIRLSDYYSAITESMTISEVIRFWFEKSPWTNKSFQEVEQIAVAKMTELIEKESCHIEGVREFIVKLRENDFSIGLATNSPESLITVVLKKTGMEHLFDVKVSAENERKGKPNPAVYLTAAKKLGTDPSKCIVIEDSGSGMKAAKEAGMKVIFFTNGDRQATHDLADDTIVRFTDAGSFLTGTRAPG